MAIILFFIYVIFSLVILAGALSSLVWEVGSGVYLIVATCFIGLPWPLALLLWLSIGLMMVFLHLEPARVFLADILFQRVSKTIPHLSETEEEALNAGDTWLERDIFIGKPDWNNWRSIETHLTEEEQAFLENETGTLCAMLNEWEITQERDLPLSVWQYIKDKGFMGLVIEKQYGGKGFSARAHSDVVLKIASRSVVAAVTVMVPNSLGPGELLQHYGTEEQKAYYLPRLAKGIDIPCFALTEPGAGSDATSIKSEARVIRRMVNGEAKLKLVLTLDKRWITLAPVATLIGLAVNLKDPEGLLNGMGREGITCILVSRDTPHLEIGNRHLPADQPFMNGTIRGDNVEVPITSIIGGQKEAGRGWQMLVECLSIGRSISLPALGAASSSVCYLTTGAFARIRRQFHVDIAQFEGIEEKLAEIAGLNYLINATRLLTVAAVNQGKKPSVVSAITKYFVTEAGRIVVNNAMDVHAGRAVVVGPRNYLTNHYQGIPISITVEGANILSRNLLIFGQGAMACHPYLRDEFYAVSTQDKMGFRSLIWKHVAYFAQNFARMSCSAWTLGLFLRVPSGPLKRFYQRLNRLSQAFAWLADLSLIALGADLKRKERLSARLADGMSYLYMGMAVLHFSKQHGESGDHLLHARWAVSYCLYHAESALLHLCSNFPNRLMGLIMRFVAFPFGRCMHYPADRLDHQLACRMSENNDYRNKMIQWIYQSRDRHQPIDKMEQTLQLLLEHQHIYNKIKDLKRYSFGDLKEKLVEKVASGVLSLQEMEMLLTMERARWDAIQVDEFTLDSMKNKTFCSVTDERCIPF